MSGSIGGNGIPLYFNTLTHLFQFMHFVKQLNDDVFHFTAVSMTKQDVHTEICTCWSSDLALRMTIRHKAEISECDEVTVLFILPYKCTNKYLNRH